MTQPLRACTVLGLVGVLGLCTLACGCAARRPLWQPPGPLPNQQFRATVHDPYADNEVGPEVVGARPREFQKPLPEAVRARGFWESLRGY